MKINRLSILRISKFFLLLAFLALFFSCFGQETSSEIDKKDLKGFIKTLSSARFEGRGIDSNGQIKTQEYIIDRYKTLQLEPFSPDGYLEKFSLKQSFWGDEYIKTKNNRKLWNFDRMVFFGGNPQNEETACEVVFGGYGTERELNQIEVENRFVLLSLTIPREIFDIQKRLKERNALGMMVFYKDDKYFNQTKRTIKEHHALKRYTIHDIDSEIDSVINDMYNMYNIIRIEIPGSEVKNIMGLSKNKLINLADMRKINEAPTTEIRYKLEQVNKKVETANVIGIIRGESEQSIILSAHYDHIGKDGNQYYPGADDNASGVAAMLELAEAFAQYDKLKYTMVFLATAAEELGLLGSLYHVSQPGFDPEQVVCNISIDMISRCDKNRDDCNYLYCFGNNQSEALDSLVRKADELFTACTFDYSENESGIFARTDAYNFRKKGVLSILFFSGLHDDYHKPTDTIDKIDFTLLENRTKLIFEVIKLLQLF